MTNWGPSGETVYRRTYSRTKTDGSKETWPETVRRVVNGNLSLVYKRDLLSAKDYGQTLSAEYREARVLTSLIEDFSIIPAGRHLWASGVKGRQYLFNCWVSGWGDDISDHFRFTFLRLMEGGGVGANYSSTYTERYGPPAQAVEVHIVCDPEHADYEELSPYLSSKYSPDYQGAYMEIEDSREGWADALTDLLTASWDTGAHQVRVYDVSRVRSRGSRLKTFGGYASGPAPLAKMLRGISTVVNQLAPEEPDGWRGYGAYNSEGLPMDPISAMEIDHEIAQCVVAGGNRRSARMSILPWDDPWIKEFIRCKADTGSHWTTNISVAVDDNFYWSVSGKSPKAVELFNEIGSAMLANGEPGLWNISLSQVGEVGKVQATNPCGEIALEAWEACNLGHINLENFVNEDGVFEMFRAKEAARLMTRFLMRATFGDINDGRSREIMDRNRRIGVGLMGVQAAFALMGIKYSEAHHDKRCWSILSELKQAVRKEARDYAFKLRIPEPVKVSTVAPTGTVAKLPGTSEGAHPIYSRYFLRRIRFSTINPDELKQLKEYEEQGFEVEDCIYAANTKVVTIPTKERLVAKVEERGFPGDIVESADELSLRDMLSFQLMVQNAWADNAVSFTANILDGSMDTEELTTILEEFLDHLKGTTIMPDGTREQAPYERISKEDYALYQLQTVSDSIDESCATGACPVR